MAPEYETLFELYQKKRNDVIIARLEGNSNEDVTTRYEIDSFPTIILYYPKDLHIKSIYQGHRVAHSIDRWIDKKAPLLAPKLLPFDPPKTEEENNKALGENPLLQQINKTEVTNELDFLRREIANLKNKFDILSQEVKDLKAQGMTSSSQSPIINETSTVVNERNINISSSKLLNYEVSLITIAVLVGCVMIFIAVCCTCKQLLFGSRHLSLDYHEKV